jgi:putative hemolysin
VYNSNYDDIVGVVNLKISLHIDDDDFNLSDLMTEAPYMMEQTHTKLWSGLRRQVFIMLW